MAGQTLRFRAYSKAKDCSIGVASSTNSTSKLSHFSFSATSLQSSFAETCLDVEACNLSARRVTSKRKIGKDIVGVSPAFLLQVWLPQW